MTGIICVNKEKDITSFGVVAKLRGITGEKKIGHAGTLDPMAQGVLPVLLGGATRFLNYLPDSDKGYRAEFQLGKTTDTLDITGNVTTENDVDADINDVAEALKSFCGVIKQIPPMYSALSVNGQRLYDLARQGIEIERDAREVSIKKLTLLSDLCDEKSNKYTIDVLCSKGTYIRTLIDDIGRNLGCGAVMTALTRTYASGFSLRDCVTLGELQKMKDSGEGFGSVIIELERLLDCYDSVYVTAAQAERFSNGGFLDIKRIKKRLENKCYRVYSQDRGFLGLGKCDTESGELRVEKLFFRK